MIRCEPAQQPHDLDIASGFSLKPPARLNPVQIAVNVKLEENRGVVRRFTSRRRLFTPSKPFRSPSRPARCSLLDRYVQSSKMVHAALLLLMLEAVTADLVFTISLKRSTQNLQLSTSWAGRLHHLLGRCWGLTGHHSASRLMSTCPSFRHLRSRFTPPSPNRGWYRNI